MGMKWMGRHKEWSRCVALLKSALLLAAGCCFDRAANIVWKSNEPVRDLTSYTRGRRN